MSEGRIFDTAYRGMIWMRRGAFFDKTERNKWQNFDKTERNKVRYSDKTERNDLWTQRWAQEFFNVNDRIMRR